MKMLQRAAALVLSAAMAVGAGALAGCGPKEEDAALRMMVDINPSVEFIPHCGRGVCRQDGGGSRPHGGFHLGGDGISRQGRTERG